MGAEGWVGARRAPQHCCNVPKPANDIDVCTELCLVAVPLLTCFHCLLWRPNIKCFPNHFAAEVALRRIP